ncbi:hypothetical protein [Ilyomonas limi]|uniref:hypothetical protein n=1 Tax=Ilyomonas limi TaxID=2575867 RepID=UPI0014853279|nr:hypothetical protein [Ilyomonas limi]
MNIVKLYGTQRFRLAAGAVSLHVSLDKDIQFNRIIDVQHMFVARYGSKLPVG